jgi:uncharacterized protein (TIGR02453 family)
MAHFTPALFDFLRELKASNDRTWFLANKARYEEVARDPMLRFLTDLGPRLAKIAPEVQVDPRPSGGSLFRIYRDTRFSRDKAPYKTHVAARMPVKGVEGVHTAGYYLHLEPGKVFGGAGAWHPEPATLAAIRAALLEDPDAWRKATSRERFGGVCRLEGDSAKRLPKGIPADHPLVEDLKRKDFIAVAEWSEAEAVSPRFLETFVGFCRAAAPFNTFLAKAILAAPPRGR